MKPTLEFKTVEGTAKVNGKPTKYIRTGLFDDGKAVIVREIWEHGDLFERSYKGDQLHGLYLDYNNGSTGYIEVRLYEDGNRKSYFNFDKKFVEVKDGPGRRQGTELNWLSAGHFDP